MKIQKNNLFLILLILIISTCIINSKGSKEDNDEEHQLLILNDKNIHNYINAQPHFFVLFHNPWCKWSQNLEQKLVKINKLLKMEKQKFYLGLVDTTIIDVEEIMKKNIPAEILDVNFTYPRIVYFENGKAVDVYNGRPNKDYVYTYIKRKLHKDSMNLPIMHIFNDKVTQDKNAFILFDSDSLPVYKSITDNYKQHMFYHTKEDSVRGSLNPNNATMIYYSYGKQKDLLYTNTDNIVEEMNRFILKNTRKNLYNKFDAETIEEIFMKNQSAIILFRNVYDNKTMYLEESIPMISKQEKKLLWVVTDLTGKYAMKLAKLLSVSNNDLPAVRIVDMRSGFKRYELTRDLATENVLNFVKYYRENKLTPYLSTQRMDNDAQKTDGKKKELVKRITSASFYENVIFNKRNVLVFFYTSWCGRCKKVI